jgi:hypothetical protein
MQELMAQ